MLPCFIYYLRIWAFRKYMPAKIPGMVQGYHILAYSLKEPVGTTDLYGSTHFFVPLSEIVGYIVRPKKKKTVFPLTCRKINKERLVRKSFYFLSNFCLLEKDKKKCLLSTVSENIRIMKFGTSRKLKNMILSINFAILTFFFFFFCPIFWNILGSVGMKVFLFFSGRQ